MNRSLALPIAAACALLGAGIMWALAPDTGDAPQPNQVTEAQRSKRPNRGAARPTPPPDAGTEAAPLERTFPLPPPRPFVARDGPGRADIQEVDTKGLQIAAGARRGDLVACWMEWTRTHGAPAGRPTLAISLLDEGNGAEVTARLSQPQPHEDELHACFDEAFADARFNSRSGDLHRIFWPIPLPVRM